MHYEVYGLRFVRDSGLAALRPTLFRVGLPRAWLKPWLHSLDWSSSTKIWRRLKDNKTLQELALVCISFDFRLTFVAAGPQDELGRYEKKPTAAHEAADAV